MDKKGRSKQESEKNTNSYILKPSAYLEFLLYSAIASIKILSVTGNISQLVNSNL